MTGRSSVLFHPLVDSARETNDLFLLKIIILIIPFTLPKLQSTSIKNSSRYTTSGSHWLSKNNLERHRNLLESGRREELRRLLGSVEVKVM